MLAVAINNFLSWISNYLFVECATFSRLALPSNKDGGARRNFFLGGGGEVGGLVPLKVHRRSFCTSFQGIDWKK